MGGRKNKETDRHVDAGIGKRRSSEVAQNRAKFQRSISWKNHTVPPEQHGILGARVKRAPKLLTGACCVSIPKPPETRGPAWEAQPWGRMTRTTEIPLARRDEIRIDRESTTSPERLDSGETSP